jgi:hypothetical protein
MSALGKAETTRAMTAMAMPNDGIEIVNKFDGEKMRHRKEESL